MRSADGRHTRLVNFSNGDSLRNRIRADGIRIARQKSAFPQHLLEELPRVRLFARGDFLRRAFADDFAAFVAAFRAEINQVVRHLDDIQIVLDHQHAVARFGQALQDTDELVHVCHV